MLESGTLRSLGLLSLLALAACGDRVAPIPSEAKTSGASVELGGITNAMAQDAEALYAATSEGVLWKIDKSTLTRTKLADVPANFVDGIALDATDIYFTVLLVGDRGEVWRVAKTGGAPVIVASGFQHPGGIALDATTLYVADMGTFAVGASGKDGVIRAVPKTGGDVVVLAEGEQLPFAIALDATGVIWGNTPWGGDHPPSLRRIEKTGGTPVTLAANADAQEIDVVGSDVYWRGGYGIFGMPTTGGDVRTVSPDGEGGRGAFTVDGSNAYFGFWGTEHEGEVLYVPLAGGDAQQLVPPNDLAADPLSGATIFVVVDACKSFAFEYKATYSGGMATIVHRYGKARSQASGHASVACAY